MEEKKGVWQLEFLEPAQNSDEQNNEDETEESK
jgi:hypothetical protein